MGDENPDDNNFEFIKFLPEGDQKTKSSRDYTGKGLAKYANNEIYEGEYVDGVTVSNLILRKEMEKANIITPMVTSTLEISSTMLSMELVN